MGGLNVDDHHAPFPRGLRVTRSSFHVTGGGPLVTGDCLHVTADGQLDLRVTEDSGTSPADSGTRPVMA